MTAFIFIPFFAPNLTVLLVGQILQGLPWGVFQTLTTSYAAEVTPVALRPFLTTWVNGCWVVGQLIASGLLRATVTRNDHWAYKIPYAVQWVWPVPIFIGCWFAPESPWWLVRQNRLEDAKRSIRRLAANDREFSEHEADQTVQMMIHTNELEKAAAESSSYWDCFKRTDLRRTEIASVVWVIQIFCGQPLMTMSTYFYVRAGLAVDEHLRGGGLRGGGDAVGHRVSSFVRTRPALGSITGVDGAQVEASPPPVNAPAGRSAVAGSGRAGTEDAASC